jgi:hypothetical protein
MEIASETETFNFLSGLWLRWSETLLTRIASHYKLNAEQKDALIQILSKPNDWIVQVDS